MYGLDNIVKFISLSEEKKWDSNRFNYPWLEELDEYDKGIIGLLDCLRDGEFSAQASATQLYDLIFKEKENGYSTDLANDWVEIFILAQNISNEEIRHGLALTTIYNYVTKNKMDQKSTSIRDFGGRYMWCFEDRKYWDLYEYALSHLYGEVVNTETYRELVDKVHHPKLKELFKNIMTDEARHTSVWTASIKRLIQTDSEHERRALKALERGLVYHNGMVHETFFEGMNKMLPLFTRKGQNKNKPKAIDLIIKKKHKITEDIFGDKNQYTEKDIWNIHMKYLSMSAGHTRAKYTNLNDSNINFG